MDQVESVMKLDSAALVVGEPGLKLEGFEVLDIGEFAYVAGEQVISSGDVGHVPGWDVALRFKGPGAVLGWVEASYWL